MQEETDDSVEVEGEHAEQSQSKQGRAGSRAETPPAILAALEAANVPLEELLSAIEHARQHSGWLGLELGLPVCTELYVRWYLKNHTRGYLEGMCKLLARMLRARLGPEAPRFVSRLEQCTPTQLEAAAVLLVPEQAREGLIAALEGVLTTSA